LHLKYNEYIHELSGAVYEEIKDKTARKLRCIHCTSCGKLNFFRFASLPNGILTCKSCNAAIPIEEEWIKANNEFLVKPQ